jgi:hypothetical protein
MLKPLRLEEIRAFLARVVTAGQDPAEARNPLSLTTGFHEFGDLDLLARITGVF